MDVYILGCSHTAGSELMDEYIFDNYWDYKKDKNFIPNYDDFQIHQKKILEIYNGNMHKYQDDCKQLNWATTLSKKVPNRINVRDHSYEGVGISFFRFLYNNYKNMTKWHHNKNIKIRKRLKKHILESDVLIWQLTDEPRYFFNYNNLIYISHSIDVLENSIKMIGTIDKWKIKNLINYYKHMHDQKRYMDELLNFLDMIILKRILLKKHTLIFSFDGNSIYEKGYKNIESKYVKYEALPYGLKENFIKQGKILRKDVKLKFNHITKKVHDLTANFMFDYINKLED